MEEELTCQATIVLLLDHDGFDTRNTRLWGSSKVSDLQERRSIPVDARVAAQRPALVLNGTHRGSSANEEDVQLIDKLTVTVDDDLPVVHQKNFP